MKVKFPLSPIGFSILLLLLAFGAVSAVKWQYKNLIPQVFHTALRDYTRAENLDINNVFTLNFPERPLQEEYDFIVVGSGPAGCVLANRLSEDGKHSVLLLEAGSPESPATSDIPISSPFLQSTNFNWGYSTTVQSRACLGMGNSSCHWPHGKVLGGSSVLYYMIYTRGNRRDFDNWARAGNPGWSWADVLPYFKRSENATSLQFANPFMHGTEGPLPVEDVPFRSGVSYAHVQAAQEAGYRYLDYNAGEQIGVSFLQQSTSRGRRVSAARAYLHPVRFRKNLHIATHSTAKKLIFSSGGAGLSVKGVVVKQLKSPHDITVRARKEVILSAGAFESSKLLMLSGVGPAQHLRDLRIPVVKDLPVGQTLYEHMGVMGPVFTVPNVNDGLVNLERVLTVKNFADYFHGRGPLTMNGVESLTYIKTNTSQDSDPGFPDVEIMQAFGSLAFDTSGRTAAGLRLREDLVEELFKPLENTRAFFYLPMLLHPRSKGFMRLQSKDYLDYPLFEPNFFADPRDLETLVAGMEEAIRLAGQPSMRKIGAKVYTPRLPTCPWIAPGTHDYWRCWAQTISATFHHQVGTCKMGPAQDPTTVVDHTLRVHGFRNLRVADIGIIPQPPSGHTNAYSFMIGEKASDMIRESWDVRTMQGEETEEALKYPDFFYLPQQRGEEVEKEQKVAQNYQEEEYLPQYANNVEDEEPEGDYNYHPKYFVYRHKRSTDSFDWQKTNSGEEMNSTEATGGNVEEKNSTESPIIKPVIGLSVSGPPEVAAVEVPKGTPSTLNDLRSVLRPSEVDISSHERSTGKLKSVVPLNHTEKSGLEELLEGSMPSVDEDAIRTVTLDSKSEFDKGKNKPQIITDLLAHSVNTTEFEEGSFPADNATKAVQLPILDGKLEEKKEEMGEKEQKKRRN